MKQGKLCEIVKGMSKHLTSRSITVKIRTGLDEKSPIAHKLIPQLQKVANGRLAAIMVIFKDLMLCYLFLFTDSRS